MERLTDRFKVPSTDHSDNMLDHAHSLHTLTHILATHCLRDCWRDGTDVHATAYSWAYSAVRFLPVLQPMHTDSYFL